MAAKIITSEHNEKFEQGIAKYKQTLNQFADMDRESFLNISTGFAAPPAEYQMMGRAISIPTPPTFPKGPAQWDWRALGKVTPVKDQGYYCNCCWAFATIAAVESHIMIYKGTQYDLSEQNLIDCNRNDETGNWGCLGGSTPIALRFIMDMGIQTTATYPFDDFYPYEKVFPCRANSSLSVGKIKSFLRLKPRDEISMRNAVAAVGPLSVSLYGSMESFMYYSSGIYDDPECPRLRRI